LKQTACFKPVNDECIVKKTNNLFKKPAIKIDTLKRQVSQQRKANNFTVDYKDTTHSPVRLKTETTKPKPPTAYGLKLDYKEDLKPIRRASSKESNRLPSIKPSRNVNNTINFEIDTIMTIADQYKGDLELQSKVNALVKNIKDIKSVLQTKRYIPKSAQIRKLEEKRNY
jgi:hypothetical protein